MYVKKGPYVVKPDKYENVHVWACQDRKIKFIVCVEEILFSKQERLCYFVNIVILNLDICSTQRFIKQVKYPSLDGGWHHVCTSWTCVDGRGAIYIDGSQTSFIDIGNGTKFPGGGTVFIGSIHVLDPPQLEGEITYMNLWDKVLSNARIENLALSCSAEAGNVLQWSLFAAMSVGNIQVVPFSACREKGIVLKCIIVVFLCNTYKYAPLTKQIIRRGIFVLL